MSRFDARLAALSPIEFIEQMLVRRLEVRWVLVGRISASVKARWRSRHVAHRGADLQCRAMLTVAVAGDGCHRPRFARRWQWAISSTPQRCSAGRFRSRAALHGNKLGRNLGFPTANIPLRGRPLTGFSPCVSTDWVDRRGLAWRASASADHHPGCEAAAPVFVFDFDEAIYGRRVTVNSCKLRDEARYPDLDALTRQIRGCRASARLFRRAAQFSAIARSHPVHSPAA
jgi:riboflavin kinase/FMN adenylyltransferase